MELKKAVTEHTKAVDETNRTKEKLRLVIGEILDSSEISLETRYFSSSDKKLLTKQEYDERDNGHRSVVNLIPTRKVKDCQVIDYKIEREYSNTLKETTVFKYKDGTEIKQKAIHYIGGINGGNVVIEDSDLYPYVKSSNYEIFCGGHKITDMAERLTKKKLYEAITDKEVTELKLSDGHNYFQYYGRDVDAMKKYKIIPEDPQELLKEILNSRGNCITDNGKESLYGSEELRTKNIKIDNERECKLTFSASENSDYVRFKDDSKEVIEVGVKSITIYINADIKINEMGKTLNLDMSCMIKVPSKPISMQAIADELFNV